MWQIKVVTSTESTKPELKPHVSGVWRHGKSSIAVVIGFLILAASPARAGLIITPTFDSSITSDANAFQIENSINTAISVYEALFTNPINVLITFQEGGGLGSSTFSLLTTSYSSFRSRLAASATGSSDAAALAALPIRTANPVTGSSTVLLKSANAKALGYSVAAGSDGTITVNTSLTNPGSSGSFGSYSLLGVTEHEINEILGLGSTLGLGLSSPFSNDPSPEDFFRYDAGGERSFTLNRANSYLSINGATDLVRFNNPDYSSCGPSNCGDYADWASGGASQVQDAFATAGSAPTLGSSETTALDLIGYTIAPEPGTAALFPGGLICAFFIKRRTQDKRRI